MGACSLTRNLCFSLTKREQRHRDGGKSDDKYDEFANHGLADVGDLDDHAGLQPVCVDARIRFHERLRVLR